MSNRNGLLALLGALLIGAFVASSAVASVPRMVIVEEFGYET